MKKGLLLAGIITWLAILVIMIAVIAVVLPRGGWGFLDNTVALKEENISLFDIADIQIETDSYDIEFVSTGEPQMKVLQYGNKNTLEEELFTADTKVGSVKISVKRLPKIFSMNLSFNERLVVEIPQNWLGDISVKVFSGDIRVNDAFTWQNVSFSSSSGDLLIGRALYAENLSLHVVSGDIQAREALTVTKKISAESSSGDIRLEAPITARNIYAKALSGDIVLGEAAVEQFELQASSGDIKAAGLNGRGSVRVNSGDIHINLTELLDDVEVEAGSGDIRIDVDPSLSFEFTGRCSSGDIRANFPLHRNERGNRANATVGTEPAVNISVETTSGDININQR